MLGKVSNPLTTNMYIYVKDVLAGYNSFILAYKQNMSDLGR